MQLKNYLHLNNISASDFALNIGVCRATISRWIGGSRFPSKKLMLKIYTNTNGLVKVDDFYHIEENNQLQLINDIKEHIEHNNVPLKQIASKLNITTSALSQKLSGKIKFSAIEENKILLFLIKFN